MGAQVVRALTEHGASAVPLSRRTGFDLSCSSREDLLRALDGVDAVIDCSDAADRKPATFAAAATVLAEAAGTAGVARLALVSIIGVDRPGLARLGYYQGKLAQERALAAGTVPVTVVRTAQWYEFADMMFRALPLGPLGRFGAAPLMRMQPVAGFAVARRLASAVLTLSEPGKVEVAGPEPMTLADLIRRVGRARGVPARVLRGPGPGRRGVADGSLLPGPDAERDLTTVEDWAGAA